MFSSKALARIGAVFAITALADLEPEFRVQLSKQNVPVVVNNRTVMHKTAYYGQVHIGYPNSQKFTVVFDTGSGHVILPSVICQDESCLMHRRYNKKLSQTAVDLNFAGKVIATPEDGDRDRVTVQYGTGDVIGAIMKEMVCVGEPAHDTHKSHHTLRGVNLEPNCGNVWMVSANEMSSNPFAHFEFDGVFGLGLSGLAIEPDFHALSAMTKNRAMNPLFGIFLSKTDHGSEISFGGVDHTRMKGEIHWAPILRPQEGYWRVKINGLYVGGEPVAECQDGQCTGIVDSGTSMLGVPHEVIGGILTLTARRLGDLSANDEAAHDCREDPEGPLIEFDLGDIKLALNPTEYMRPAPLVVTNSTTNTTQSICRAALLPVNMPTLGSKVFLLGEPILQRYYTTYDAGNVRVGFALAVPVDAAAMGPQDELVV